MPLLLPLVSLLALPSALAGPPGLKAASRTGARPLRPQVQAPAEPPPRRVAVGFSRSPTLREALRGRLIVLGRYRLDAAPQLPDSADGLLVGGRVVSLAEEDGFYHCRANFFVAARPYGAAVIVDSAAAGVPLPPARPDRAAALYDGKVACLEEIAVQIAARLGRL